MLTLDHLVVSTTTLAEGAAEIEAKLGVPLDSGGQHPAFGTHNRLLSLGPDDYLEVIAIDPNAAAPTRSRWFALDRFRGSTRLTNWAVRTTNLSEALALGVAEGTPVAASRGALRWTMVVPDDGELPLNGIAPALLQWRGTAHPCDSLPDRGVRLKTLLLSHPDIDERFLPADPRVKTERGPQAISATFETPSGDVTL
ncbi:MAG: VOC family protein [Pseudomonadota bacterium]